MSSASLSTRVRLFAFQKKSIMLRSAVIFTMFVLTVIASLRPSSIVLLLFLAACAAFFFTVLIVKKPSFGVTVIPLVSMLVPISIGPGGSSSINAPMLFIIFLTGLWFFFVIVSRQKFYFRDSRTFIPLVLFLAASVLAFLVGQLNWFNFAQKAPLLAQAAGLAVFVLSAAAFLVVTQLVHGTEWLERMVWIFLILGAIYLTARFLPTSRRFIERIYQYGSTSSLFWTWMVVLSASQILFNQHLSRRWKIALGLLLVATFYQVYGLVGWKSGWLPALVGFFVLLYLRFSRLSLSLGLIALITAPLLFTQLIGSDEYSYSTRVEAWRLIVQIIKVNPITGFGPANYYWYTPLFPILGYSVNFNSHNQYIDLIAQTGLIGLVCFLWFAAEVGVLGWRLRDAVPAGFPRAFVYGALAGLVSTLTAGMLGDWILPYVYNVSLVGFRSSVYSWLFLGGLVVLEQAYLKADDHAKDS